MKLIGQILFLMLGVVISLQAVPPVPYSGKVAINGVNYHGEAKFTFFLQDKEGKVRWRNGTTDNQTIRVQVFNGRYTVLLGGQGMNVLPPQLFLDYEELYLRVRFDNGDGKGLRNLTPYQRITSSPHALVAEVAKVANSVKPGSVTKGMLSREVQKGLDKSVSLEMLEKKFHDYSVATFKPKVIGEKIYPTLHEGDDLNIDAPFIGEFLEYEWYKDGNKLENEQDIELSILGINPAKHSGNYRVVASNDFGSAESNFTLDAEWDGNKYWVSDHVVYFVEGKNLYSMGQNIAGLLGIGDVNNTTVCLSPQLIGSEGYKRVYVDTSIYGNSSSASLGVLLSGKGNLYNIGESRVYRSSNSIPNITYDLNRTIPWLVDSEVFDFGDNEFFMDSTFFYVKNNGVLWGMGKNASGQLGTGDTNSSQVPVQIAGSMVNSVNAGGDRTFFTKLDGSLWGMGNNNAGQLGTGDTNSSQVPVQIVDCNVVSLSSHRGSTIFTKTDGSLWGFGRNQHGQLGTGGTNTQLMPVQIVDCNVKNALVSGSIRLGQYSLFLKYDGSLWGMGYNNAGQLGTGNTNSSQVPVQIVDSNVRQIFAYAGTSYFIKTDGSLWGMGYNTVGQLGTGNTNNSLVPVLIVDSGVVSMRGRGFRKEDGSIWGLGKIADLFSEGGVNTSLRPVKLWPRELSQTETILTGWEESGVSAEYIDDVSSDRIGLSDLTGAWVYQMAPDGKLTLTTKELWDQSEYEWIRFGAAFDFVQDVQNTLLNIITKENRMYSDVTKFDWSILELPSNEKLVSSNGSMKTASPIGGSFIAIESGQELVIVEFNGTNLKYVDHITKTSEASFDSTEYSTNYIGNSKLISVLDNRPRLFAFDFSGKIKKEIELPNAHDLTPEFMKYRAPYLLSQTNGGIQVWFTQKDPEGNDIARWICDIKGEIDGSNYAKANDMDIVGNILAIGIPEADIDGLTESGTVVLYELNDFGAKFKKSLKPSNLENSDGFGFGVCSNGVDLFISSYNDEKALVSDYIGKLYKFKLF